MSVKGIMHQWGSSNAGEEGGSREPVLVRINTTILVSCLNELKDQDTYIVCSSISALFSNLYQNKKLYTTNAK